MEKLGFGTMRLPILDPSDDRTIDMEEVKRMVDYYIENGGSYFDLATAYHHGAAEGAFKEAVADRYPRDKYTITGKLSYWLLNSYGECESFFQSQLRNCGVEYFDYYMYHAVNAATVAKIDNIDGYNFVKNMKAQGKIRHIGCQFHDGADALEKMLTEHPEIEFVHYLFNYAEWDNVGFEIQKCYEVIERMGKWIVAMFPVMSGVLNENLPADAENILRNCEPERTMASWAVRYAASAERVRVVLVDASNLAQMKDNVNSLKGFIGLSDVEVEAIKKVNKVLSDRRYVQCTGCGECMKVCPENIQINKIISWYSDQKQFGYMPSLHRSNYYDGMLTDNPRASNCTGCGKCLLQCPKKIDIPEILKEASAIFDSEPKVEIPGYVRLGIGEMV